MVCRGIREEKQPEALEAEKGLAVSSGICLKSDYRQKTSETVWILSTILLKLIKLL